ncbi:trigger factor [Sphingoaurantiacus capsulatus]|uniref:Trigger factor n=1 Tax=Sphingoaurantiacus capsulatus TaxID=1771310 RepID=A0ABV7XBK6_9SPHN
MRIAETLNEGLKREYSVTIPAKDLNAKIDAQVATVAKQIRMPGFRPGKVPLNLVKKMHGASLRQDALQEALNEGVQKVIADKKLRPAMQPQVDVESIEEGKDVAFKVAVEVLPTVQTPAVDGIKLEKLVAEPTDADMNTALQRLADQQKSFEAAPAKHAAKTGDVVVMDFVGTVDGEAFEGGTGEGMQIELGSGRLIPGFEEQLEGVKANDQRTVKVTFPDDYNVAYLKGREAQFAVTVNEIRTAKEASLDDELAKNLGLESLDKLKEIMKDSLGNELAGLSRTYMKRKLLDHLAASHDFDVPQSMVEAEFGQIWQQLEHEAGHEADVEAAKAEIEKDRDEYRRIAERRVRLGLLLSEIGQANDVQVTQQEMNRLIMQEASRYPRDQQQQAVKFFQENAMASAQLRAPLYEEKVVDFLLEKADLTERKVSREELEAAIESEDESPIGHVHGPGCGHDHHDHDHSHAKPKAKKAAAKKEEAPAAEAKPVKAAKETKPAKAEKAAEKPVAEAKPAKKAAAPKKAEAAPAAEKPAKAAAPKKAPAKKA